MYSDSYALIQRLLHWSIAVLIMGLLAIGFTLGTFGFEGISNMLGGEFAGALYKYHKTFGVVLLGLMVLRLACRLLLGKPEYSEPVPLWNRVLGGITQILLYGALFAMPIIGWAATAAGGFPIEFFNMKLPGLLAKDKELSELLYGYHELLGWVILGLAALHIAGAMYHWMIRKDRVMGRMSLF